MLDLLILVCAGIVAVMSVRWRSGSLTGGVALVLAMLCVAQWWAEGFYWQFVPVYAILVIVCLARFTTVARAGVARLFLGGATALTVLLLLAAWVMLPVPRLPQPTGAHAVGTAVFRWIIPSAPEPATTAADDRRNVIVQAWYPSTAQPDAPRAPYLDGLGRLPTTVAGIPRMIFNRFDRIDTHAAHASAVDPGQARWPVVIFSPGYGASRAFYTSLLSDLASRGFIVLAVDHPYESAITQLVDGSLATPIERFLPEDSIRFHYMVRHTAIRVADLRAVLDAVVDSTERTPFGALAGRMDHTRIAAVGHSFGGAASVATAAVDSRVRASVNIDGSLYGSLPDQSLTQPFLLIESDRAETKHGRQFVDGLARLMARLRGPGMRCQLARANHFSFTDAPMMLAPPWRWAVSQVLGGSRGTPATVRVTNDLLVAFLGGSVTATAAAARCERTAADPIPG